MINSTFEFPNGRCLCELRYDNIRAQLNGDEKSLYIRFKVSRYYNEKIISVHNCYGEAEINKVAISRFKMAKFFTVTDPLPEFELILNSKQIEEIEKNRLLGDVNIRLHLNVLFSQDKNYFKSYELSYSKITLFATIPKSVWIEEVLQDLEYLSFTERIVDVSGLIDNKNIFESVTMCRKNFIEGRYEEVLREGYTLLENLPITLGYKNVKDMFSTLESIDDVYMKEKYKNLNDIYGGIKNFTHLSRHGKTVDNQIVKNHISKADANYFLVTMETLIEYILVCNLSR